MCGLTNRHRVAFDAAVVGAHGVAPGALTVGRPHPRVPHVGDMQRRSVRCTTTPMNWDKPCFEELRMDAEIGSYQEDTDPEREMPTAEPAPQAAECARLP